MCESGGRRDQKGGRVNFVSRFVEYSKNTDKKVETFYVQNIDKAEKMVYNVKVSVRIYSLNLF